MITPPIPDAPELTVEMAAGEWNDPLPGQTFKSLHEMVPWQMSLRDNPMSGAAVRLSDQRENERD